jgi:phosphatidate cytidylyltransferase
VHNSIVSSRDIVLIVAFLESGFAIGCVAMMAANRKAAAAVRSARWIKTASYFFITHIMVVCAACGPHLFGGVMTGIAVMAAGEMVRASLKLQKIPLKIAVLTLFGFGTTVTLLFSYTATTRQALFLYLSVAVLDSYSQLTGQLFGHHPIAPGINPKKSIEGAFGGLMATLLTAVIFHDFAGFAIGKSVVLGLAIGLSGILGDLGASWFKRKCGIIDYSRLLPGQGGFMDRFNSLLAAAAIFQLLQ